MKLLTRAEEMLLIAIWRLRQEAYGVRIRELVEELTGQKWAFGAIFVTLDRLAKQDFVTSTLTEPTQERGGRSKRVYQLTVDGKNALMQVRKIQNNLWDGLENLTTETA